MKKIVLLLAVLLGMPQQAVQNIPPIQAGDIIITGGQLFDGVRDTAPPDDDWWKGAVRLKGGS